MKQLVTWPPDDELPYVHAILHVLLRVVVTLLSGENKRYFHTPKRYCVTWHARCSTVSSAPERTSPKTSPNADHFYGYLLYAGINASASYVGGRGLQCRPSDRLCWPRFLLVSQQHETGHQRLLITQKPPSKLRISNVRQADGFRLIASDKHVSWRNCC